MTSKAPPNDAPASVPDEVFSVLGNETRLEILYTLARADGPCAFTDLYDASEYEDPSNFNYHLKQLTGQFVRKTEEGYTLYQTGAEVVSAMLSGTLTEKVTLEQTTVDRPCPSCGGDLAISYAEGHLWFHCDECGQEVDNEGSPLAMYQTAGADIVGKRMLPPASVQDRSPMELLRAAEVYSMKNAHSVIREVCPSCSARVDLSVTVCDDHDTEGDRCDACGHSNAAKLNTDCTNCIMGGQVPLPIYLLRSIDMVEFTAAHGRDPVAPNPAWYSKIDETIVATEPFEAHYTYTDDGDSLTLAVTDDLSIETVAADQPDQPER